MRVDRARAIGFWLVHALACGAVLPMACRVEGENNVSRRLVKAVELTVSGRVVSAESSLPLAGMQVAVLRSKVGEDEYAALDDAETSTGVDGRFSLTAELDVESYLYLLAVSDPEERYATDSNTEIYALKDGATDVGEVALVPTATDLRGLIHGSVSAAVGGEVGVFALEGASVQGLDPSSGEALTESVKTDAQGHFELPDTPFRTIDLRITAPDADPDASYSLITEVTHVLQLDRELPERADAGLASVDVGPFWLPATARETASGKRTEDFLTVVLSWDSQSIDGRETETPSIAHDLDARLYLPGADCNVNHLGGKEVALASGAALDPAGMGSGTCFWPPFLGGDDLPTVGEDIPLAVGNEHRVLLSEARPVQFLTDGAELDPSACPKLQVAAARRAGEPLSVLPLETDCGIALLNHVSQDGREPEVLTLFHNRFTREWPEDLGYYYELEVTQSGEWSRRYPMAIAAFTVVGEGDALGQAKPIVEVYDQGAFVARYTLDRLAQETTSSRWTPFLIEMGSRRPSASSGTDLYTRVVSYEQVAVSIASPPYFYQDVAVAHAEVAESDEVVGLTGASSAVSVLGDGLTVLGQARVDDEQVAAAFHFDAESGWRATPIASDVVEGIVAEKNGSVLYALGEELFLDEEPLSSEDDTAFCGGTILDFAADPDDPQLSFLVATDEGLAYFKGPAIEGDSVLEPSCTALAEDTGPAAPPPANPAPDDAQEAQDAGLPEEPESTSVMPVGPLTDLVWMKSRSVYIGAAANTLYNLRIRLGTEPTVMWPQTEYDWQSLPDDAEVLSLLVLGTEQLQDLFVGTQRGLYVLRGGPGLGDAVLLDDCPITDETGRPRPSQAPVRAIAQLGSRLFIGTDNGVAITSTLSESVSVTEPSTKSEKKGEPEKTDESAPKPVDNESDSICVRWLPTRVSSTLDVVAPLLPVLPAGLDVTDLVISEGRLYVLTSDQGLFFLNGEVQ